MEEDERLSLLREALESVPAFLERASAVERAGVGEFWNYTPAEHRKRLADEQAKQQAGAALSLDVTV